jgi:hypothetical protein
MYSVQHVLWRGAMALSLVVVGGIGAGVSAPVIEKSYDTACREEAAYVFQSVNGAVKPELALVHTKAVKVQKLQTFDVVVIKGIPPMPDEA